MSVDKSFRIADPSRVVRMILERDDKELSITFVLLPEGSRSTIEVRCRGVGDMRFRGETTELTELVLLLAEDISSTGWEGARYRVKDYEEEFVSFVCRSIDRL